MVELSFIDIPSCKCGHPRKFEFQIMPQLLNFLNLDPQISDLDWGTVVVFSCSESCPCEQGECAYVEEFAWKQDCS